MVEHMPHDLAVMGSNPAGSPPRLFGLLNLGSIPGKENSFLLVAFLFLRILGWETTKMKSSSRVILT